MRKLLDISYSAFMMSLLCFLCFATSCEEERIVLDDLPANTDDADRQGVGNRVNCPSSHPFEACGQCWTDAQQAASGGCNDTDGGGDSDGGDNGDGVGASNARLAILDIEINLGIDIDDEFIAVCDYQGAPPGINPRILVSDAKVYFRALLGRTKGNQLGDDLNTNGDQWLTRNEASMAKRADPRQVLNSGLRSGLAMDDVLSYIGLYMGDGKIDKYAGDLGPVVQGRMATFTRTWQPDLTARYGK